MACQHVHLLHYNAGPWVCLFSLLHSCSSVLHCVVDPSLWDHLPWLCPSESFCHCYSAFWLRSSESFCQILCSLLWWYAHLWHFSGFPFCETGSQNLMLCHGFATSASRVSSFFFPVCNCWFSILFSQSLLYFILCLRACNHTYLQGKMWCFNDCIV